MAVGWRSSWARANGSVASPSFAGLGQCTIDDPRRRTEPRFQQGLDQRPGGRKQTAVFGKHEKAEGTDDVDAQGTGESPSLAVVEKDAGGTCLNRQGDRFGFSGSKAGRRDRWRNRIFQGSRDDPGRLGNARRLADHGRWYGHRGEKVAEKLELADLGEGD